MPILNFYKAEASRTAEGPHLFENLPDWDDKPKRPYDTVEDLISSFFQTGHSFELPVLKTTGSGKNEVQEWEKYRCDVLRNEDGIILCTVENNKVKHTTVGKKDLEHEHHPFCYAILDVRPGHLIIGIEKNSAFDGNPDKVAGIIRDGLSMLLMQYHQKLEISSLKKTRKDFWPIIHEVRTKFNDMVRQIRLDFNGEEKSKQDGLADTLMQMLSNLARKSESDAVFMLNAKGEGEVNWQEVYDDLTNIADICLKQPGYDLTVRFKKFGVYRYGADLLAQFGTDDKVLDAFINGVRELDFDHGGNCFALVAWMDKIYELLEGYAKNTALRTGRKTRNRK